jgi:hypothetical protein
VLPGPGTAVERSPDGPCDRRLGLAELRQYVHRPEATGYRIDAQARDTKTSITLTRRGIFPIYHEKNQAGLRIEGRRGQPMYQAIYPREACPDFQSIPPLVVATLLFIENREILDDSHPYRNPAVQRGRLNRAV